MEYFLAFLAGFGGVIAGALAVKLWFWLEHKKFEQELEDFLDSIEVIETKPVVSDTEEKPV